MSGSNTRSRQNFAAHTQMLGLVTSIVIALGGCAYFAVKFAPDKMPVKSNSEIAKHANTYFWETLHAGRYDSIPQALTLLKAAYLENPNDPTTTAHIAFLHIWKLSERNRLKEIPPDITDHAVLARKYFEEAVKLNPEDPRLLGFYAVLHMIEGDIHGDEKLSTKGFFIGKESIKRWSEFNYFTVGYVLSTKKHTDPLFEKGLEWQWKTMDECYLEKIDRTNPSIEKYLAMEETETNEHRKRACWNSWIAPHNVEGFYLNMGDMLVKSGDWETAAKIYENAKLIKGYESWPFKEVLEERTRNAEANVEHFRKEYPGTQVIKNRTIMINSEFSCMACHQR